MDLSILCWKTNLLQKKLFKDTKQRFDCFIAYADQRIEKLKPNLEQMESEHGLKFRIPDRDFIPGANVVDNITNAISSSKRMVCFILYCL